MKKLSFIALAFVLFLCSACTPDPIIESEEEWKPIESDESGNLLIINSSNDRLVLYKGEEMIRQIPLGSSDYWIYLPNPSEGAVELSLYKWDDVKEDTENPPFDLVFKKWKVVLSNESSIENSVTWHVGGSVEYKTIATISLSYFGGTDNSVDVYLNGRTGAKIKNLKPGDQYKKIGVDYGNYTVHYRYWYSDQGTSQSEEEIGWIETEEINGEDKDIWLILNESRNDITTIIPHYGSSTISGTQFGNIEITNLSGDPVMIYAGDQLIESVCYLDNGSTQNLSTINHNGNYTYLLPIYGENVLTQQYHLIAKHLTNSSIVEEANITIEIDNPKVWIIDGDTSTK